MKHTKIVLSTILSLLLSQSAFAHFSDEKLIARGEATKASAAPSPTQRTPSSTAALDALEKSTREIVEGTSELEKSVDELQSSVRQLCELDLKHTEPQLAQARQNLLDLIRNDRLSRKRAMAQGEELLEAYTKLVSFRERSRACIERLAVSERHDRALDSSHASPGGGAGASSASGQGAR